MLAAFREFKRREAVGLAGYYANKLAALEVSPLFLLQIAEVPAVGTCGSWHACSILVESNITRGE